MIRCELSSILPLIESKGYKLISFDFGGTLYDFTPLHVRAFLTALDIDEESDIAPLVAGTVRTALARGLDSFEMMRMIAEAVDLRNVDLDRFVVKKRLIVEESLKTARLDDSVCSFLLEVMNLCS